MLIHVNGEERTIQHGTSVTDLLRDLHLRDEQVAVEVNLTILDRGEFSSRVFRDGDRVEIISFIGGGSNDIGL